MIEIKQNIIFIICLFVISYENDHLCYIIS